MSGCSKEKHLEENALAPYFLLQDSGVSGRARNHVLGMGVLILNKIHMIRHAHNLTKKKSCLFIKPTRTRIHSHVTQATCCTFSTQAWIHITENDVLQNIRGLPSLSGLHGVNNDLPGLLGVSENTLTTVFTTQSPDDHPLIQIFHSVCRVHEGDTKHCPE